MNENAPIGTRLQFDKKRIKKMEARVKELTDGGMTEDEAHVRLAREQYEALPVDQKIRRLEQMVSQSVAKLGEEMINLRHNDQVIADALDINFRAMAKALVKAGVSHDDQAAIFATAQEEIANEMAARANAQRAALPIPVPAEPVELTEAQAQAIIDKPADVQEEPILPEGAAVFGG